MTRLTDIIKDMRAGVDIKKIDLYKSGIGNEEVKLLLQALEKYNNTVTEIDLDGNRITNEGAGLIAHFLEENSSVTYIDLSNNKIGDEGARLILKAIRKNNTLTKINLHNNKTLSTNKIDYSIQESIDKILEKNRVRAEEAKAEETLSKKSDQGIDSIQEKLPVTGTKLEENQNISKGIQQLKQDMQDGIMELIIQKLKEMDQKLDVVIGEVKLLSKEQSSMQVGQTQLTENSLGTGEHPELLLGVVAEQYYSPE
ncbi:hypothetical protein [Candidatus Tisiphia endosymbiont of Mystacides longicornis]|uniref:hypothetical protein n=1 Tax=Candidatus Tisiphia endosymbiont of Mystacides longicornis TaxID=3139330 RepID=UPI003CCAF771